MTDLTRRARRRGTRNIYAGDEPRSGELTEHWPRKRAHRWERWSKKKRRIWRSKRTLKLRRKDRANRRAAVTSYRARLAAPWLLYVKES